MYRKSGYYHVKVRRKFGSTPCTTDYAPAWVVREWHLEEDEPEYASWSDGAENLYPDTDILEVNETRIPSPDENEIIRVGGVSIGKSSGVIPNVSIYSDSPYLKEIVDKLK